MTPHDEPPPPALPGLGARAALAVIGFYQRFVSPALPPSCRFYPSCSRYTYDAIARFGLRRGGLLGLSRVCRCHPWHPGGVDPLPDEVPPAKQSLAHWLAKIKLSARRRFASWRN